MVIFRKQQTGDAHETTSDHLIAAGVILRGIVDGRQRRCPNSDYYRRSAHPHALQYGLHIAEKAGVLIPADRAGRARVTQWCFTALNTLEPTLLQIQIIEGGGEKATGAQRRPGLVERASEKFKVLEQELSSRSYLAGEDFTVADILMTTVLREIRRTDLIEPFSALKDYFVRCQSRPAWQRTLRAYEVRMSASEGAAR